MAKFHSESKTGPFPSVHRQVWGGIYREAELWSQRDRLYSLATVQTRGDGGSISQPPFCRVVVNVCPRLPAPCLAHSRSLGDGSSHSQCMMELRVRKWTPHCLASRALAQELFSLCREMKMAASQAAKENLLVAHCKELLGLGSSGERPEGGIR